MRYSRRFLLPLFFAALGSTGHSYGQSAEELKLQDAALALEDFQNDPTAAIPIQVLENAQGIVVLPKVFRAGFIFGARRGKGVAVIRSENGAWSNPLFITITGGSVGAQIGGESTDLVIVFGNRRSVRNIGEGKFTMSSNISVTAGPVGLGSRGATDMTFTSQVYYYARGRGLFAGAVLGGAKLDVDEAANSNFYSPGSGVEPLSEQSFSTPVSAKRFLMTLSQAERFLSTSTRDIESENPEGIKEEAEIYPLGTETSQQR